MWYSQHWIHFNYNILKKKHLLSSIHWRGVWRESLNCDLGTGSHWSKSRKIPKERVVSPQETLRKGKFYLGDAWDFARHSYLDAHFFFFGRSNAAPVCLKLVLHSRPQTSEYQTIKHTYRTDIVQRTRARAHNLNRNNSTNIFYDRLECIS